MHSLALQAIKCLLQHVHMDRQRLTLEEGHWTNPPHIKFNVDQSDFFIPACEEASW